MISYNGLQAVDDIMVYSMGGPEVQVVHHAYQSAPSLASPRLESICLASKLDRPGGRGRGYREDYFNRCFVHKFPS